MRYLFGLMLLLLTALPVRAEPFKSPEAVPAAQGYAKTVLAEGLERPWSMDWLPDGGMLLTERPGNVRLFRNGSLSAPLPGLPEVFARGQGGMLDISLHPRFSENRLVYFTYATGSAPANRTTLGRATFDGNGFSDFEELFRVSQAKPGGQHFGSRILWLRDASLLISVGDGGNPPVRLDRKLIRTFAQDPKSHLGKILHLRDDGTPAREDTFPDIPAALPEIHSMGHRNIQGLAYDPIRNAVWSTEHGALGGDELNLIEPGANYGWPEATFSKEYLGAADISDHTSLPGKKDPRMVWMTAIAPSGLTVYTGDAFPDWKGDLFAGGLRDQSVRRIILDDSGRVTGEEIIRVGQRVRDVRQGPDGRLYILTDETDGRLIRLDPSAETDPDP